ncbi:MAG: hypothetical protein IJ218_03100 [Alphaproteobacteria bacterium]|nr:hypothetical protein [Alphaproteobacteria bacterium]
MTAKWSTGKAVASASEGQSPRARHIQRSRRKGGFLYLGSSGSSSEKEVALDNRFY